MNAVGIANHYSTLGIVEKLYIAERLHTMY